MDFLNVELNINKETDNYLELKECLYPRILYGTPFFLISVLFLNLFYTTISPDNGLPIKILILVPSVFLFLYSLDMIFIGRTIKIDKVRRIISYYGRFYKLFFTKRIISFDKVDCITIGVIKGPYGSQSDILKIKGNNVKDLIICVTDNDIYLNRLANLIADYLGRDIFRVA